AHLGTITAYVRVTGLIEPAPGADWTATAPDKALVTEIRYAPGDYVRQGAVVARFDAPPLRADVATRSSEQSQARARLDNARRNHERLSTLLEKGIAERWHNPGDVIDANEHVLRVVDLRRLQVTAAVPVADALRVVVGHAARVT